MGFPSRKEIDEALKRLEKVEGTLVGPKSSDEIDVFRHQIQQSFVKYVLKNKLNGRELAKIIGIDEAQTSKILSNRIDAFSTDKLIQWYKVINPRFKIKLVA